MIRTLHSIPQNGRKLNVCAYARVSADKNEAEMSLSNQISYYTTLILENENWEYCGVYADEGISGASLNKRIQFQNMVDKAMTGLIDIILVKSISRFGRNITDVIGVINNLRTMGVEVFFEKENISSLDATSTVALNMYAQLAESELKSMKENIRWSVDKRMRKGIYRLPVENMLGYQYDASGKLYIVEKEAEAVRLIFDLYNKGITQRSIADVLMKKGYKTGIGSEEWSPKKIQRILVNEKYVGDCRLQKEYCDPNNCRNQIVNRGEKDSYYVKDGHPAIITRDVWDKACALRDSRATQFHKEKGSSKPKVWPETTFGICPFCGRNYFIKRLVNSKSGIKYCLTCSTNKQVLTCRESESVFIDDLREIITKQIKILKENPLLLKNMLKKTFLFDENPIKDKINLLNKQINSLRLKINNFKDIMDDARKALEDEITKQIDILSSQKKMLENDLLTQSNNEFLIKNILNNLDSLPDYEFSEDYRKLFKKVVIKSRTDLTFIIGSDKLEGLDLLNLSKLFTGTYDIKFRAQIYTVTFGVFLNANF